jgi:hypothetical protein
MKLFSVFPVKTFNIALHRPTGVSLRGQFEHSSDARQSINALLYTSGNACARAAISCLYCVI